MSHYPLPKYHFVVDWGGSQTAFWEVSGLSMEVAVIEHRDGSSANTSSNKIPGLRKFSNLILKRGIQKGDRQLFDWMDSVGQGTNFRRDVVISLLNEEHQPILLWKVHNAWPCKYEVAPLNATSNEVLIESIELAHEGLELAS